MAYPFGDIEKKWQKFWKDNKTFRAVTPPSPTGEGRGEAKPKYYALDMFPYPSGAGLHVGHPLGYIASDIVSRYKRLKGFNVLHPMGYDSFGLPAEQYAIQTGQHPEKTTKDNIARYREQMDKIGFSFDWDREVRTSDPNYYKWTQWIFIKLFNSWYNSETDKAESIDTLIKIFETEGSKKIIDKLFSFPNDWNTGYFTPEKWKTYNEKDRSIVLMNFRLAYLSNSWVNWCPQLGTVLANEEVKDGVSERGGYPVERKLMPQWSLRITAYANRLLNDLDTIDWSESIKEAQRNWIGKSEGSSLRFQIAPSPAGEGLGEVIEVFTTRPDTVFGVTFLTLAPESDLVAQLTTPEQKQKVDAYIHYAKNRSERERQSDVKKVTGQFTGAYAIHPFTGEKLPIWIGDYVLAGYGTGAVMGVPAHDSRDHAFAKHFGLQIKQVVEAPKDWDIQKESFDAKEGKCINSDLINGLEVKDALKKIISEIEKRGLGKGKTQFRLRDAIFGRQRYWGEPIPVYYKDEIPHVMEEKELPLVLPEVDKYLPTEDGEPPLARAKNWKHYPPSPGGEGRGEGYEYEKTTMPGWAGSSWYYLRYMDPQNKNEFAGKDALNYWKDVDLYIGGAEHATGHLLYVRFWTKFLFDLGLIPVIEPAKKLINQGMIQGRSNTVFRFFDTNLYISNVLIDEWGACVAERFQNVNNRFTTYFINKLGAEYFETNIKPKLTTTIAANQSYVDVNIVKNDVLDQDAFRKLRAENSNAVFLTGDDGQYYYCGVIENEKMSKSKLNVVTPDDICTNFGADTLRLYEMFLGPLEQSKPWNTAGITGVFGFLNKFWRLFHSPLEGGQGEVFSVSEETPTKPELKILHKTIKKIQQDIENYSFNTSVSAFMICANELTELKCNKRKILEPLVILLSPFAPHIAEELWEKLGYKESITFEKFPEFNEALMTDDSFAYPISFNGKMRFNLELSLSLTPAEIEKEVLANEQSKKFLEGKHPKKVIVVPKRIVNIVM